MIETAVVVDASHYARHVRHKAVSYEKLSYLKVIEIKM